MIRRRPLAKIIFDLIEAVLTLVGFIAVITPLALWAVPQVGDFSVVVYYYVVSIGVGAFLAVVALSRLQDRLFPEHSKGGEVRDLKTLRQMRVDWEEAQEEKLRAGRSRQTVKGYALRDIGYMAGIAGSLTLAFVLIFLPAGTILEYGIVPGTSQMILVVEKDDDDRATMRRMLLRSGYKVVVARTVNEGLAVLDTNEAVDLVLTDVMLPEGMKGPEMMRRARRRAPELKAVYTGNKSDEWELRKALGKEVAVVLKPFLAADLRAEVRAELARN